MRLSLNRGGEHVQVAVVVEVCEDARAPVRDRIDAGDAGDVHELLRAQIQIERVAFVAAKGKTLAEHQLRLIDTKRALLILAIIFLRHDLTPEVASSVLHGLAGDKT